MLLKLKKMIFLCETFNEFIELESPFSRCNLVVAEKLKKKTSALPRLALKK